MAALQRSISYPSLLLWCSITGGVHLDVRAVVPNQGSTDPQGVREKLAGGPRVHWHLTKLIYNL